MNGMTATLEFGAWKGKSGSKVSPCMCILMAFNTSANFMSAELFTA